MSYSLLIMFHNPILMTSVFEGTLGAFF